MHGWNERMTTIPLWRVRGIRCGACIGLILDALRDLPGTTSVSISDVSDGQATVQLNGSTPDDAVGRALGRAGFPGRAAAAIFHDNNRDRQVAATRRLTRVRKGANHE